MPRELWELSVLQPAGAAAMSDEPLEWVLALIKGEDDGIQ